MSAESRLGRRFVIIGGGPAGLTAAYELAKLGFAPIVVEKLDIVGGLARTATYKGFHFDIGGHRFFTKAPEIDKLWRELLPNDFLRRPRLSRIYYKGKFFHYPLRPLNALAGLGLLQSLLVVLSYVRWQLFPYRQEDTFEQWVTNRFGRHLFRIFFKTYTEKVWGISCSTLKAEWAAQRIKGLSLRTAILGMFIKPKRTITTLIEEFHYPRLGPGMMWNAVKAEIERRQGIVQTGSEVVRINRRGRRIDSVVIAAPGRQTAISASDFISSMPVTEFINRLDPPPPPAVVDAAAHLTYRDFLTVCLIVNKLVTFPDNWIYVHSPEVKVGRIQNFRSWSPDLVPVGSKSSLGLEYFCAEGDELWTASDADLIELGKREVERIGLVRYADLEDGCVVRVPKAYPVYDSSYREHLAVVREFIDQLANFQSIGRNGLHRYNNQDHAMLTGILAVRNSVGGERNDLWSVNTDQNYQEEGLSREEIPQLEETLAHVFAKLDRLALGVSLGLTAGMLLCLASLILILKGGDVVGPNLGLLSEYFPGYSVSVGGAAVGLLYGFVAGFLGGWMLAFLRNAAVLFYVVVTQRRAERLLMRNLLEYL